jgi:hypothetical protein
VLRGIIEHSAQIAEALEEQDESIVDLSDCIDGYLTTSWTHIVTRQYDDV